MGKSTKTYEERIQEKDLRIEKLAQELKRYETQKKQLKKRKKEEANGKFFSKAMQKGPDTDMKREECGESGVSLPAHAPLEYADRNVL